jgi:hypothetical protein
VLYLIVQSTFFSTNSVDDTQAHGKKIYSPFTLSSAMDAEHAEVEEHHDDAAPAEEHHEDAAPEPVAEATATAPVPATPVPAQQAPVAEATATAPVPATPVPAQQAPVVEATATAPVPATPVPATPTQEAPPAPPVEEGKEELIGFDTIDLAEPSGNWLLKRGIWEKAQGKYEQIKGVFDQVLESRMPFFKRRAEIDRQILDPLYISVGLDQEEIATILEEFNTLLSVDEAKHAHLDEREKKMQMAALEEKKVLEQLQKDVADLDKYSRALDAFLDKLIEQVNLGRVAEKQAWQAYKDIGRELNDKKARELWLGMATPFKRITDIQEYINGIFKQEFDKVDKTVQEHATHIKDALQSLKEKGLDLKKFSKELDEKLGHEPVCEAPQQESQEEGWLGMITSWWNSFLDGLAGIYDSVMSYFSGAESEEEVVVAKKKKPAKQAAAPAQETKAEPAE